MVTGNGRVDPGHHREVGRLDETLDVRWDMADDEGPGGVGMPAIDDGAGIDRDHRAVTDDAVAGEMYVPGVTIKLSKTPGRLGPVPTPGQHTDEVLGSVLGYDAATIAALRQHGAVR